MVLYKQTSAFWFNIITATWRIFYILKNVDSKGALQNLSSKLDNLLIFKIPSLKCVSRLDLVVFSNRNSISLLVVKKKEHKNDLQNIVLTPALKHGCLIFEKDTINNIKQEKRRNKYCHI